MKKLIILIFILQACTTQKAVQIDTKTKILFFLKHSDSDNYMNKAKLKNWETSLRKNFKNLEIVAKPYNVESSLSFKEQLDVRKQQNNVKYIFTYEFIRSNKPSQNRYVFVLLDSENRIIQDKVYHNKIVMSISEVTRDFKSLSTLK
ncbi:hypothetical protein [Arcicella lustrica]|uniref:Lipoprotein n=1 Tax=Arcicella lustrica TaxID=2984196 RepID=A0ABU5SHV6_9BACT|nr:hypothetical protein [Arcicella sp. DC25W]MEA5426797.1 hypothetical protein [Arcicella sp. DC25W]